MNAIISLKGLRMKGYHGVAPSERKIGNEFTLDISVEYPCEQAMAHDNLNGTINYADIADIVRREMLVPSDLLENVVWRIRESLLKAFPEIISGNIKLTKHLPPIPSIQLEGASVEIKW